MINASIIAAPTRFIETRLGMYMLAEHLLNAMLLAFPDAGHSSLQARLLLDS